MELLLRVTIPKYPRRIKIAESRNPKYYTRSSKKIPKKYQGDNFQFKRWKGRGKKKKLVSHSHLHDIRTNEKVIANPRVAGKPRYKSISGQDIWRAQTKSWSRDKVMSAIKDTIREHLKDEPPITKFPIQIKARLYDFPDDPKISTKWDLDNRFIMWQKCFQDVLQEEHIPDDDIAHITHPPSVTFYPIGKDEERRIEFRCYHDDRADIQDHKFYKNYNYGRENDN